MCVCVRVRACVHVCVELNLVLVVMNISFTETLKQVFIRKKIHIISLCLCPHEI